MRVSFLAVNEVFSNIDTGLYELNRFLHEVYKLSNYHALRKIRSAMRGSHSGVAVGTSLSECDVTLGE
jgi:hypothetical protein